jgi:hypothetical protein
MKFFLIFFLQKLSMMDYKIAISKKMLFAFEFKDILKEYGSMNKKTNAMSCNTFLFLVLPEPLSVCCSNVILFVRHFFRVCVPLPLHEYIHSEIFGFKAKPKFQFRRFDIEILVLL